MTLRAAGGRSAAASARRLVGVYSRLAASREHLFTPVLDGASPLQWAHYPPGDAVDAASGYQWFYHSHAPEDRAGAVEHGHIHLFARREAFAPYARSKAEAAFSRLTRRDGRRAKTRHLLSIAFNAQGLPTQAFTVNSWVTGDLMASRETTAALLADMRLKTTFAEVDCVIEAVCRLCAEEIEGLLASRDETLARSQSANPLEDPAMEILSTVDIDLDGKLAKIT